MLSSDLRESEEIKSKQSDFIGKANSVIANFKTVHRDICTEIFNSQCCSFYGCEAWRLSDPSINAFFVTWRKAVRRLWNLSFMTRSSLLPLLMNCKPVQLQIYQRTLTMCSLMLNSDNEKIKFISNLSVLNQGLIGGNMQFLQHLDMNVEVSQVDRNRVEMIRELTRCKEQILYLPEFPDCDIDNMLNYISIF
jgi:hypothetical protein